jgi:hypothetical protein
MIHIETCHAIALCPERNLYCIIFFIVIQIVLINIYIYVYFNHSVFSIIRFIPSINNIGMLQDNVYIIIKYLYNY